MICEKINLTDEFSFLGTDNKNPFVDIYLPLNMNEMNRTDRKRPCVIICPGGGYGLCSEREAEPIAIHFLTEGFNAFVLNYSVVPHTFPTQLIEVAATMEVIYKNKDAWNCDTEKIIIIGFSAGGHLAAHYSTMYNCKEVRAIFPESKPVNATVLCYPVITSDNKYWHEGSFVNLTGKDKACAEEYTYYSCELNVTENTPPAFIWHTADDNCVPVMNSLLYAGALSKKQILHELHIYPYGGHGLSTADITTNDYVSDKLRHIDWLVALKKWLRIMGIEY